MFDRADDILASRRTFLRGAAGTLGAVALAALLEQDQAGAARAATNTPQPNAPPPNPLAPRRPHFAPRAKRVIWLFMHGGPSHVDLFDPKPELAKLAGQPLPASFG